MKTSLLSSKQVFGVFFDGVKSGNNIWIVTFKTVNFGIWAIIYFPHSLGKISDSQNLWMSANNTFAETPWTASTETIKPVGFILLERVDNKGNFASIWRSSMYPHIRFACRPPSRSETLPDDIRFRIEVKCWFLISCSS